MAGIFISYRRADSDGWAGRLRDALRSRFGDIVFQDVDNIPDGEIFSDVIDRALEKCDVALVIIGPNWASAVDEEGRRRLDLENDWVRTETSRVLNRKIRVIPVLVGGARMPRPEDLPPDLRSLTHRQAREIRSTTWDSDVSFLAAHIRQIVGHPGRHKMWFVAVPSLVVLLGVGVFAGKHYLQSSTPPIDENRSASSSAPGAPTATPAPPRGTTQPKAEEFGPLAEKRVPGTTPEASEPAKAKPVEAAPAKRHVAEEPAPKKAKSAESTRAPSAVAEAEAPATKAAPVARPSPSARPAAPASEPPKLARREPVPAIASSPQPESRRPAPEAEAPVERPAPAAAPTTSAARTATLNLPNRPSSARDLKIGDSWTYKLKDARFSKELATVTHEVGGGDASGIRETMRAAGASSGDGDAARTIQRRLTLEPRMFQQTIDSQSTLIEFAPFLTAFTDLQPGLRWSKIASPNSGSLADWSFSGKIVGRESVRVPAGTFEAIKAELEGNADISFPSTRDAYNETIPAYQTYTIWFVPDVGREVKYERRIYNRARRLLEHEQYELQSYRLR